MQRTIGFVSVSVMFVIMCPSRLAMKMMNIAIMGTPGGWWNWWIGSAEEERRDDGYFTDFVY